MMDELILASYLAGLFFFALIITGQIRKYSLKNALIDVPNERSSHKQPTPSGGGLPLMLAFFLGAALLFGAEVFWSAPYSFVLIGAFFSKDIMFI